MSRRIREQAILEIIEDQVIQNQKQLVDRLRERDLTATQATVSRDIKRLGLVKRPARRGGYRYASPESFVDTSNRGRRQLHQACDQFLTKIDEGEALLVLKTLSGRANALAVAIDECAIPQIVATLAGDDTVLLVLRAESERREIRAMFEDIVS